MVVLAGLREGIYARKEVHLIRGGFLLLRVVVGRTVFTVVQVLARYGSGPFYIAKVGDHLSFGLVFPSTRGTQFHDDRYLSKVGHQLFARLFRRKVKYLT